MRKKLLYHRFNYPLGASRWTDWTDKGPVFINYSRKCLTWETFPKRLFICPSVQHLSISPLLIGVQGIIEVVRRPPFQSNPLPPPLSAPFGVSHALSFPQHAPKGAQAWCPFRPSVVLNPPILKRLVEGGGRRPGFGVFRTPVRDELSQDVRLLPVGLGRGDHLLRRLEPALPPLRRAPDRPGEDARRFGRQLVEEVLVAFPLGDRDLEGDEPHAPPKRLGLLRHPRLMIRPHPNLELGPELELLLIEPSDGDGVAPGEQLECCGVKCPPARRLARLDEARALEPCQVGGCRPRLPPLLKERVDGSRPRVVRSERRGERLEELRLAVRARPMGEEHTLLAGVARQRVADRAAHEGDQLRIDEHLIEKPLPPLRLRVWVVGDRRELGDQVFPPMRAQFARLEVERPVQDVQRPRVAVKRVRAHGDLGLGRGKGKRRGEPRVRRAPPREGPERLGLFCYGDPRQTGRAEVEVAEDFLIVALDLARLVLHPAPPVPDEPR